MRFDYTYTVYAYLFRHPDIYASKLSLHVLHVKAVIFFIIKKIYNKLYIPNSNKQTKHIYIYINI